MDIAIEALADGVRDAVEGELTVVVGPGAFLQQVLESRATSDLRTVRADASIPLELCDEGPRGKSLPMISRFSKEM